MTAPTDVRSRLAALLVGVLAVIILAAGVVAVAVHEEPQDDRASGVAGGSPGPGADGAGDQSPPTSAAGPTCPTAVPPPAPPRPPAPPEPPWVSELKTQVAEARRLEWRAPLVVELVPRPEMVRRLEAANERDTVPERLAGDGATFHVLDLLPRNVDYQQAREELLAAAVLGFYDPLTKELVVDHEGGEPGPNLKMTVAHELNHALTDQWFDFGTRIDALDDADRQEEVDAFVALVEGDARLLESRFFDDYLTEEEQALYALAQVFGAEADPATEAARERARALPEFLLEYLQFPYQRGVEFAEELADDGGFESVDEALCRPPTSTEQIIHPALYRQGQGWAPPEVPDVAAASGCQLLREGALGEFKTREVLELHLGRSEAAEAAGGWNGDTFQTVRCGTALGMVDRWLADSEEDAAQLFRALTRWGSAWARSGAAAGGRFSGPGGTGRVTLTGTRVDVVLADDAATADRLAAALG